MGKEVFGDFESSQHLTCERESLETIDLKEERRSADSHSFAMALNGPVLITLSNQNRKLAFGSDYLHLRRERRRRREERFLEVTSNHVH